MIKVILKRNNILLSQFASDLNISRPTLDSYIKNFDNGIRLTNNLYQKIFEFLFCDAQISVSEFQKKYMYIVTNYGNRTNVFSNSQSSSSSVSSSSQVNDNVAESMLNYLGDDLLVSRYDKDEYTALSSLLVSSDPFLKAVIQYNLVLKEKLELKELSDKELMLVLNLYNTSKKISSNDYSYDNSNYLEFEGFLKNKMQSNGLKDNEKKIITEKLSEVIANVLVSNNNLSTDDIIEMVKSKLGE